MISEVQALGAALSLYKAIMLKGALEIQLRNSHIQAYQGTWSAPIGVFTVPDLRHQAIV